MTPRPSLKRTDMEDAYPVIYDKRSWRFEGLLYDRPLPCPLARAGQLGKQVSTGILLPWDVYQFERHERPLQNLNIAQVCSHLWIFRLVLPVT